MKVCPLCKSEYEDWIDFCFNDGIPLTLKAEPAAAAPPVEAAAPVATPPAPPAPAPAAAPPVTAAITPPVAAPITPPVAAPITPPVAPAAAAPVITPPVITSPVITPPAAPAAAAAPPVALPPPAITPPAITPAAVGPALLAVEAPAPKLAPVAAAFEAPAPVGAPAALAAAAVVAPGLARPSGPPPDPTALDGVGSSAETVPTSPLYTSTPVSGPTALPLPPAFPAAVVAVVPVEDEPGAGSSARVTGPTASPPRGPDAGPGAAPPGVDPAALGEIAAVLRDVGPPAPVPPDAPPVVERAAPARPPEAEVPWADSPEPTGNGLRWVIVGGVALFGFFGAVAVVLWLFSQSSRPPVVASNTPPPPVAVAPVPAAAPAVPEPTAPPAVVPEAPPVAEPPVAVAPVAAAPTAAPATLPATPVVRPTATTAPTTRTEPPPTTPTPAVTAPAVVTSDISPPTTAASAVVDAAPAEAGVLRVLSDPDGASVYVNEQARGKTPLALQLPYGTYRIRVVLAGFRAEVRDASLHVGDYTVPFKLKPEVVTGQVNVYGPGGYRVVVDGQDMGPTPVTVQVSEGTRQFKLVAEDGTSCVIPKQITFNPPGKPQTVTLQCP